MTVIADKFSRGDFISSCAGVGGVWKRIASFNTKAGVDFPSPWVKSSHNGVSFCIPASTSAGCYSVVYSTNGTNYNRVCGRASAYQKRSPDGFRGNRDIDNIYVDGLSITHGSPRKHIWTYACGLTDSANYPAYSCPCAVFGGPNPPAFVGSDYYCESGAERTINWDRYYVLSDALWDGAGCSANNSCCSNPNLPWFYHQLSESTQDDLEVRSCMDQPFSNEAILITNLETLYSVIIIYSYLSSSIYIYI